MEIRELLRRHLERAGYAVLTTGSGAEAIQMLEHGALRLVVLALGLPDVDGVEVLRGLGPRGACAGALRAQRGQRPHPRAGAGRGRLRH